jgi:hypothetical protein
MVKIVLKHNMIPFETVKKLCFEEIKKLCFETQEDDVIDWDEILNWSEIKSKIENAINLDNLIDVMEDDLIDVMEHVGCENCSEMLLSFIVKDGFGKEE